MYARRVAPTLLMMGLLASGLAAQGIVVDEGRFVVSFDGQIAGTEEFTILRAGLGPNDAIIAEAVVILMKDGQQQEVAPLLKAAPPDGIATCFPYLTLCYTVDVTGPEAVELRLHRGRAGRRYEAVVYSEIGEERWEFPVRPGTRVLERDVAHQYYFLRDAPEGSIIHTLEPRSRTWVNLEAGPWTEEEVRLGQGPIQARRVEFFSGDDRRIVWFDRVLGRVLRVAVPATGYVAERTDLVW